MLGAAVNKTKFLLSSNQHAGTKRAEEPRPEAGQAEGVNGGDGGGYGRPQQEEGFERDLRASVIAGGVRGTGPEPTCAQRGRVARGEWQQGATKARPWPWLSL